MSRLSYMMKGLFLVTSMAFGNDALLHNNTSYDQKQVSMSSYDNWSVAVWSSYKQDASSGGIFGTMLNLPHSRWPKEIQVNEESQGNQTEPDVAVMADGSFAVCWRGPWKESDNENILLRLFDCNGLPRTSDMLVNTITDGVQRLPRIAALPSAGYVVCWESHSYPDRQKKAVCFRIFDSNGLAVCDEVLAADQPYAARNADVSAKGPDQFILTWLNDRTSDSVWARTFDLSGIALGNSFQVNEASFKTLTCPKVAANLSGDYVVVWDGDPNSGAQDDIHVRFFDVNNVPLCPDYQLNISTPGAQQNPVVALTHPLCAMVAWESNHLASEQGTEVMTRFVDANGLVCGPEACVINDRAGDQRNPSLVMTSDGVFVLAWESSQQEINNTDIHYCSGRCPSSSDINADSHTDFQDFSLLAQLRLNSSPDTADVSLSSLADLEVFCSEWLTRSVATSVPE